MWDPFMKGYGKVFQWQNIILTLILIPEQMFVLQEENT